MTAAGIFTIIIPTCLLLLLLLLLGDFEIILSLSDERHLPIYFPEQTANGKMVKRDKRIQSFELNKCLI